MPAYEIKNVDFIIYLLNLGVPLIKINDNEYRHPTNENIIFTKYAYYLESLSYGDVQRKYCGSAVDYLMKNMYMTFDNALNALTGEKND